jgi:hypothetical protein
MRKDRNGIPIIDDKFLIEMKKGRNACQRPPLRFPTSSNREERTGATLGRYLDIWPSVKWVSTLG